MGSPLLTQQIVLRRVKSLPSMSTVISEISGLVNDAFATAADFEKLFRKDAGLTVALLKLANSAAFGLQGRITSIEHATSFLGINRMLDLAICASFSKVIPRVLPGYLIQSQNFWKHNAATAVFAERLAKQIGIAVTTDAFTCGLLHDCGKLAISQVLKGADTTVCTQIASSTSLSHTERELLGMDHGQVGELVVSSWHLPRVIADAARWHHSPLDAPAEAQRDMIGVVHLASVLADRMAGDGTEPLPEPCQTLMTGFRLSEEQLQRLIAEAQTQIDSISQLL